MYKQTKEEIKALKARAEAVEKEKRRLLVDAAKKRAAAQNVDYPTFAAMVSVAHLESIQRKRADEVQPVGSKWTPRGWSLDEAVGAEDDKLSQSLANDPLTLKRQQAFEREATLKLLHVIENVAGDNKPRKQTVVSGDMFIKEWRKLSCNLNLKMRLLRKLRPEDIPRIFKAELPSRLLTDMLETLRGWQLNGMTCFVAEDQAVAAATKSKENAPSVSGCSNSQEPEYEVMAQAQEQQHQEPVAAEGTFSPELLRTLANIRLLNQEYAANVHEDGADQHCAPPPYVVDPEVDGESDEEAAERAGQLEWVANELASIAESRQPTKGERSQRFQQLLRNKKMLWLLRFLHALTRCGRFDLALKMGRKGRATASTILDQLVSEMVKEPGNQGDACNTKRSYYECRLNFVVPTPIDLDAVPTELNMDQIQYLRAIYLH